MNEIIKTIKKQSTEMLQKIVIDLMYDYREGTDLSFDYVLAELGSRMSEKDFNKFCDNL
jgi:hypothetical protein